MKRLVSIMLAALMLLTLLPLCVSAAENVVYLKDGGSGDGSSADKALGSLEAAYAKVMTGGTIVICGPYTLTANYGNSFKVEGETCEDGFNSPANTGAITITGSYGGVDYVKSAGAKLSVGVFLYLNGETVIKDIHIENTKTSMLLCCNGNKVTLDTGITTAMANGASNLIGVTAGRNDSKESDAAHSGNLTVNSGDWQMLRGGNRNAAGAINGDIRMTVNGGSFAGQAIAAGNSASNGNIIITINGGTFSQFCATVGGAHTGNVDVTISGGQFKSDKFMSPNGSGGISGDLTLTINGGTFTDVKEMISSGVGGKATLKVGGWKTQDEALIKLATDGGFTIDRTIPAAVTTSVPEVSDNQKIDAAQTGDLRVMYAAVIAILSLSGVVIFRKKSI